VLNRYCGTADGENLFALKTGFNHPNTGEEFQMLNDKISLKKS